MGNNAKYCFYYVNRLTASYEQSKPKVNVFIISFILKKLMLI